MKPSELEKLAVQLFGRRAWQTRLAEALGVDASTIRRYKYGTLPIPNPVQVAVRCMADRDKLRHDR